MAGLAFSVVLTVSILYVSYKLSSRPPPSSGQVCFASSSEDQEEYDLKVVNPEVLISSVTDLADALENSSSEKHFFAVQSPYSEGKKKLRAYIESKFNGEARRLALRSVVPVYDRSEYKQEGDLDHLSADVFYSIDNFAGIGLIIDDNYPMTRCRRDFIEMYENRTKLDVY